MRFISVILNFPQQIYHSLRIVWPISSFFVMALFLDLSQKLEILSALGFHFPIFWKGLKKSLLSSCPCILSCNTSQRISLTLSRGKYYTPIRHIAQQKRRMVYI